MLGDVCGEIENGNNNDHHFRASLHRYSILVFLACQWVFRVWHRRYAQSGASSWRCPMDDRAQQDAAEEAREGCFLVALMLLVITLGAFILLGPSLLTAVLGALLI